ncbi:MAG: M1 family metallopeptidase [Isosphaeraceae bacterium]
MMDRSGQEKDGTSSGDGVRTRLNQASLPRPGSEVLRQATEDIMIHARDTWVTPLLCAGLIVLSCCHRTSAAAVTSTDVHSFARPEEVRVTRVDLDLTVDFEARRLKGVARLAFERPDGSPADAPLRLDTRGLRIFEVTIPGQPGAVSFTLGANDPVLGVPLTISVPPTAREVAIRYETTPGATALQWLDAKGTAGGKKSFLFTQSEAIHARSWIPLQDSPAVRIRYAATIRVPQGTRAVMSADDVTTKSPVEPQVYRFRMDEAIPPYLIALAVGELEFKPISDRTGVWAEPSVVAQAAHEFADTETMVKAAEARYGPYRWGRYDILVLPPSFPFGGMENPKLTFATPTVLAGDRSLVSLVAHELAHSWSGNLVTNATWRDFWLNEGFTTYIERRIVEDLYGTRRAGMERALGMDELRDELKKLPPRDQILHLELTGRDPDEGMTQIAYEKGALFLSQLEHAFGRSAFDAFLRSYFDHFAFRSITTADFVAFLRSELFAKNEAAAKKIPLKAWLEEPGLPQGTIEPDTQVFEQVDQAAADWAAGKLVAKDLPSGKWSTQEWLRFLQALPDSIPSARLAELDAVAHLTERGNSEIVCQWLTLAIRHGYRPADARIESFLTTIGRRKFLMPLYSALLATPEGALRARAIFDRARPFYHPISADSVAKLIESKTR